jgi:von Willebrand factor A domain-containing protein 7
LPSAPDPHYTVDANRARARSSGARLLKVSKNIPLAAHLLCVLAIATLAFGDGMAEAFIPTNFLSGGGSLGHSHEEITTNALEALDSELLSAGSPSGSMRAANHAIADGNISVDDDQGHSALHFDGENFVGGQIRLLALKDAVVASLQENDAEGAREQLGEALHTIQDFYAHSNWTNNNSVVNPDLGVVGHLIGGTLGLLDPAEVDGVLTPLLTSGYYHDEDSIPMLLPTGHKDRHGGPTDFALPASVFGDGLNRDSTSSVLSPQFALHQDAARLAGDATKKFIREIADLISAEQLDLLLGKGPTLAIVIDTTNSMGSIIAGVRSAATQLVDERVGTDEEPSQYVLGQINDPVTPPPVVTANPVDFESAIAALTTSPPGLDCPELAMEGMLAALGPADPHGQLFVWTDASAKDTFLSGTVSALARSKNIQVTFMLFGSCSPIDPGYIQIANETGGQVFFLTRDQLGEASNLPGLLVGTNSVTLLSVRDSVASGTKAYTVPVDSTLRDVTFSADTPSMQIQRPNGDVVQVSDADVTALQLTGGSVVKILSPAVGSWTITIGVSSTFRLQVSGSSSLDMSRFRFVQPGGRDGHEGLYPIPGLPVAGAISTADAVLTPGFTNAQFDLRRPDGDHIQDLSLAPLADVPREFGGTVSLPSEPFLAYVTGQDAGGNPFQRTVPRVTQPQSVSIVAPLREELHPGAPTTYTFKVMNHGDAGAFDLTAKDDKGFLVSADPSRATIAAGGSADVVVVLQPPADAAPGTSDALTVRAASTGTPGLENFASLRSVVVQTESTTTTSSTSTTSEPQPTPTSTTITTASSSTTSTAPCTTPRCTIDAGLRGPECGNATIPSAIRKKLDRATTLIDRAGNDSSKKARRLLRQAKHLLELAGKAAGRAAKGKKPKLTTACAAAIQRAAGIVRSALHL